MIVLALYAQTIMTCKLLLFFCIPHIPNWCGHDVAAAHCLQRLYLCIELAFATGWRYQQHMKREEQHRYHRIVFDNRSECDFSQSIGINCKGDESFLEDSEAVQCTGGKGDMLYERILEAAWLSRREPHTYEAHAQSIEGATAKVCFFVFATK